MRRRSFQNERGFGLIETTIASLLLLIITVAIFASLSSSRKILADLATSAQKSGQSGNLAQSLRTIDNSFLVQTNLPTSADPKAASSIFGIPVEELTNPAYTQMWNPNGVCNTADIDRNCLRNSINMVTTVNGNFGDYVNLRLLASTVSSPRDFHYTVYTVQNIQGSMTWAMNLYNNLYSADICRTGVTLSAAQFKKIHPDPNFQTPLDASGNPTFDVVDLCICPTNVDNRICPKQVGAPAISQPPLMAATLGDSAALKVGIRTYKRGTTDHDNNTGTQAVDLASTVETSSIFSFQDLGASKREADQPFYLISPSLYACQSTANTPNGYTCSPTDADYQPPGYCVNCQLSGSQRTDLIRRRSLLSINLEFSAARTQALASANVDLYNQYRKTITGTRDGAAITNQEIIRIPIISGIDRVRVCYDRYINGILQVNAGQPVQDCADRLNIIFLSSEPGIIGLCRVLDFDPVTGNTSTLTIDSDGTLAIPGNLDKYRYCGQTALGTAKLNLVDRTTPVWTYSDFTTTKSSQVWESGIEWAWDLTQAPFAGMRGTLAFAVAPVDTAGNAARGVERTPQSLSDDFNTDTSLLGHYLATLDFGLTTTCNPAQNALYCPGENPNQDEFGQPCPGTLNNCASWPANNMSPSPNCQCNTGCPTSAPIVLNSSDPSCNSTPCADPCPVSFTNSYCPNQNQVRNCPQNRLDYTCPGTKPPDCPDPNTIPCGQAFTDSCGRSCGTGSMNCQAGCPPRCGDGICQGGDGETYCNCVDCAPAAGCTNFGFERVNDYCGYGSDLISNGATCCCTNSCYATDNWTGTYANTGLNCVGFCEDPANQTPQWVAVRFCVSPNQCTGPGSGIYSPPAGCTPDCSASGNYDIGTNYPAPNCPGMLCFGSRPVAGSCTCPAANTKPCGQPYNDNCGNYCGLGTMKTCVDQCTSDNQCPGIPAGECDPFTVCGDSIGYCASAANSCSCRTCQTSGWCNCSACFTADMQVDTPHGLVPIKSIRVGDEVYSFDVETNIRVVGVVEKTYIHEDWSYGIIELSSGHTIEVTSNHPFYLPDTKEWKEINDIKIGQKLLYVGENHTEEVTLIKKDFSRERRANVYNFQVKKYHNYFINGVLVHNKGHGGGEFGF